MIIHYPFKPFVITQQWGNPNPAYKAAGFPFDKHNGLDASTGGIQPHYPVYCPVEGFKVSKVATYPNGGGNQIELVSKERVQIGDKLCFAYLILCHAEKVLVAEGYEPRVGELLMVADNTGFSTGEHTHIGLYRMDFVGTELMKLDTNDAGNTYNPALLFSGRYAVDVADPVALLLSVFRYSKYKLSK